MGDTQVLILQEMSMTTKLIIDSKFENGLKIAHIERHGTYDNLAGDGLASTSLSPDSNPHVSPSSLGF